MKTTPTRRTYAPFWLVIVVIILCNFFFICNFIDNQPINQLPFHKMYSQDIKMHHEDTIRKSKEGQQQHFAFKKMKPTVFVPSIRSRGKQPLVGPIPMPSTKNHTLRQKAVVRAMEWAWKGYKDFAYGSDILNFESMVGEDWSGYDIGLTLVDSLDTLYMMGMDKEFKDGVQWVANNYQEKFTGSKSVNLFETTIRELGGLLSAYHFSGEKALLDAAVLLGDRLMFAFTSPSKIPLSDVNMKSGSSVGSLWNNGISSLSEVATVQLEFHYLSKLTNNRSYADAASVVMDHLAKLPKQDGLLPIYLNPETGSSHGSTITLGARGDSYYEYLLKQDLLLGGFKDRYEEAMNGVFKHLLHQSSPNKLSFISELINGRVEHKMDHLVCFLPGVLALGYVNGQPKSHLEEAEKLAYTCYQLYERQLSGLAPEIVVFVTDEDKKTGVKDFYTKSQDDFNLLRPETVESLMILYAITKDEKYRTWGWNILQAFEKHSRLPDGGYATLFSVSTDNPTHFRNEMPSFFIAETLKYLFLLFAEDSQEYVPLDKYVFNTEAHPIPVW